MLLHDIKFILLLSFPSSTTSPVLSLLPPNPNHHLATWISFFIFIYLLCFSFSHVRSHSVSDVTRLPLPEWAGPVGPSIHTIGSRQGARDAKASTQAGGGKCQSFAWAAPSCIPHHVTPTALLLSVVITPLLPKKCEWQRVEGEDGFFPSCPLSSPSPPPNPSIGPNGRLHVYVQAVSAI